MILTIFSLFNHRSQFSKSKSPSSILRKFTTKLKPPTLHPKLANSAITSSTQPSAHRCSTVPAAPQDSAAIRRQQAALRRCGLMPTRDLSQLEEELDQKYSHVVTLPQDQPEGGELSTAEKIRREWQGRNEDSNGLTSDSLCPERPNKSDSTGNAREQKSLGLTIPASPHTLLDTTSPVSLYSIPGTFPDIPEEGVEIEKVRCHGFVQFLLTADCQVVQKLPLLPPTGTVDPLDIPLPDSPLCPSVNVPEPPSTLSPRESRRPPPITTNLTTIGAKGNAEEATLGMSPNRRSVHSLTTKSSLPALSPTVTTSSSSSISTPRDDESRERMDAMITPSSSGKSWSSRFGKVSDTGRISEDLNVVHETIPESPEPTTTESKTQTPNRESANTMGSAGFEAFVEKREKKKTSNRRNSGSSSTKSTSSELSFGWTDIANDFTLKPLDGGRSRSSTLFVSVILGVRSPTGSDPFVIIVHVYTERRKQRTHVSSSHGKDHEIQIGNRQSWAQDFTEGCP